MPLNKNQNQGRLIIIGIAFLIIFLVLLGVFGILPIFRNNSSSNFPTGKITINMWGLYDNSNVFASIFKSYENIHKNVKINYKYFNDENKYKNKLIESLASKNGPDIFMIKNSWVDKYKNIINKPSPNVISSNFVKKYYPEVVYQDFVRNNIVFALPIYIDSLALFYNKDFFDSHAIAFPPSNWNDFVNDVSLLRSLNGNKIEKAGTALGSYNVRNFVDIISSLILQSGSNINNINKNGVDTGIYFDNNAYKAFKFYLQFANPLSPYYTWNSKMGDSLDEFIKGNVAMIFEYKEAMKIIKNKNPFLNYGVSMLPQLDKYKPVSSANYIGLSVSKQSNAVNAYVAWDFIKYFTTNPSLISIYANKTDRLPALRYNLNKMIGGKDDVFVRSAFISRSWEQIDSDKINDIFSNSIKQINDGMISVSDALKEIKSGINNLYEK